MTDSRDFVLTFIALTLLAAYVCNIIQLGMADAIEGMEVLRAVGIFAFPLGIVLGLPMLVGLILMMFGVSI